jgi:hypothetical protein
MSDDMLKPGGAIFVDENGLINSPVSFFKFAGYAQPSAGKGLILGSDTNGETIGATSQLATIKAAVAFAEVHDGNHLVQTTTPWEKENVK